MKLNRSKHEKQIDYSQIDKEAMLEELVETYGNKILRLAFTYVKDQKIAEDITQEVFLRCYQKWDSFRGESSVKTWLYSITINQCKDYLKSWSFRNLLFYDFTPKQTNLKDSVYDQVLENTQKKELAAAIFNLPVKYRIVIVLFYYENYKVEEISTILDLNEGTIRTRLKRARALLKKSYWRDRRDENGR